jgi:hypothetical protein
MCNAWVTLSRGRFRCWICFNCVYGVCWRSCGGLPWVNELSEIPLAFLLSYVLQFILHIDCFSCTTG